MRSSELDYHLPQELIAQRPAERRDGSRLLVYDRTSRAIEHRLFGELPDLIGGALTVVNDTRVIPARLQRRRGTGGAVEILLLEREDEDVWTALARPSRRLRPGEVLDDLTLVEALGGGRWRIRVAGEPAGEVPLPPYVHERLDDSERYQTVYAEHPGSAAAPTAGLHFTDGMLAGLEHERVTLHVGLDTFRPLTTETLEEHELHGERYSVTAGAWERIARADRVLAVGTTTTRVLETVSRTGELAGRSSLFITPGFAFRRVDHLLTNFHLPRTSLLALVMAFAGVEETRRLYAARSRGAISLLLVRRCDARPLRRCPLCNTQLLRGNAVRTMAHDREPANHETGGSNECPRSSGVASPSGVWGTTGIPTGS